MYTHIARRAIVCGGVAWFALAGRDASAQDRSPADPFAGFDAWAAAYMAEQHVPGMAVGVVSRGRVLMTRAYGYRDLERRLPMTTRTLLPIGSATKSFTATLLAMLVEERRLDWQTRVRDRLPEFRLADSYATEQMTLRDLLSHRSGLPGHDHLWYGRRFSREEILARLRFLESGASFRDRYQYNNLMYLVAGMVSERAAGRSWEEQLRTRLFTPLGMHTSTTSLAALGASADHASGHLVSGDSVYRIPYRSVETIAPAGAINSSVEEMLRYIQFRLTGRSADGAVLLSRRLLDQMETPVTPLGDNDSFAMTSYGLGVQLAVGDGHPEVSHAGGIDGFAANMAWFPHDSLGIIVLTNTGNAIVPAIVKRELRDRALGLPFVDRVAMLRQASAQAAAASGEREGQREPAAVVQPGRAANAYVGHYEHRGYGTMQIRQGASGLELAYDDTVIALRALGHDRFALQPIPRRVTPVTGVIRFEEDARGELTVLRIPFERTIADIPFQQVQP